MSAGRVETLVWVFVYGGLALVAIGAALQRGGSTTGWHVVVAGAALAAVGAALVWVRSRMNPISKETP